MEEGRKRWRKTPEVELWPPHVHVLQCVSTHTHTHTHTAHIYKTENTHEGKIGDKVCGSKSFKYRRL